MTVVYPGDFIATVEEREPGANTFEENGSVFSAITGKNASTQRAACVSGKAIRKLARGDDVIGLVQDLYDTIALVEFQPVNPLAAASNTYAYMRISEIQRGYTESFKGFLHIGDVFKAKVVDVTPLGIYLTIAERGLGVIRAFCTRCRKQMALEKDGFFRCAECGSAERRKIPLDGVEENNEDFERRQGRDSRFSRGFGPRTRQSNRGKTFGRQGR